MSAEIAFVPLAARQTQSTGTKKATDEHDSRDAIVMVGQARQRKRKRQPGAPAQTSTSTPTPSGPGSKASSKQGTPIPEGTGGGGGSSGQDSSSNSTLQKKGNAARGKAKAEAVDVEPFDYSTAPNILDDEPLDEDVPERGKAKKRRGNNKKTDGMYTISLLLLLS